jgi:hypothetical protein
MFSVSISGPESHSALNFDFPDQLFAGDADIAQPVLGPKQQAQQLFPLRTRCLTGGDPSDDGIESAGKGGLVGTVDWGEIGGGHFASPTVWLDGIEPVPKDATP